MRWWKSGVPRWIGGPTPSQRQRWLAAALLDLEPRLRKVKGYRHLPKLRKALQRELQIEPSPAMKVA